MKYLIVGLGNIGAEYHETRHNIGFMVLDALAKASNIVSRTDDTEQLQHSRSRVNSLFIEAFYLYEPEWKRCTILDAAGKIPLENVLIVVDDLALPSGSLRLKVKEAMRDTTD